MILLSFVAVADAACFGLVLAGAADQVLEDRIGALGFLFGIGIVLALLARIPATILFIVWAVRSRKNLDAFGAVDLEYSTFFPWYFICPLLNLFVPLLAFQEIWRESEPVPKAEQRNSKVIYLWWIALVCSGVASMLPKLLSQADRLRAERGLAPLQYASSSVTAALAVTMIWRLLERQRRHPRAGAVVEAQ